MFDVDLQDLIEANSLKEDDIISSGYVLVIPRQAVVSPSPVPDPDPSPDPEGVIVPVPSGGD